MNRSISFFRGALLLLPMFITACSIEEKDVVQGVKLDVTEIVMEVGSDTVLSATVIPEGVQDKSVMWYSDNEDVAMVTLGHVIALSQGNATITVKTVDGGYTASCLVKVVSSYVAVDSLMIDKDELELMVGNTDTLKVTMLPPDPTDTSLIWDSSNPLVVSVHDGVITALEEGESIITAYASDGKKVECSVHVVMPYIPVLSMKAERLPDMNQARADHVLFYSNGQLTVAGGHVYGFSPTASAEYLADDGEWHTLNMNYPHDMAFSVLLSDGRIMIGGGCSSGSGVGQSSEVETYNPSTHSFSVLQSMTLSRTLSRAVELDNGNVAVSGNWYSSDAIELYSASTGVFSYVSGVTQSRSTPYMLQSGENDAILFGPTSNYGYSNEEMVVDRLSGTPFSVSLFETWRPVGLPQNWRATDCSIGEYSYLICARNSDDQLGILKVEGESFSVLETKLPIPMEELGNSLTYSGQIFTNSKKMTAFLPAFNGNTSAPVYYILKVDYSSAPAVLTLYRSDELDAFASIYSMTMLPDGRLVACGGISNSNYTPYSTVWAFSPF